MKREFVIKLVGGAVMQTEHDNRYLVAFDVSKYDMKRAPLGGIKTTDDAARALAFFTADDAKKFWAQEHGVRPDGKPNRPLTAFMLQIERLVEIV